MTLAAVAPTAPDGGIELGNYGRHYPPPSEGVPMREVAQASS